MTVHIDIARSTATLAEVVDLVEKGETVIIDRAGKRVGALTPEPGAADSALMRAKAKHPFVGALAHLGPLTEEEATLFLGPDPEMERLARSEDEDEFYR